MPRIITQGKVPMLHMQRLELAQFKGVDLTSGVVNVHKSRSPDAPNLMPDADGYPKKRPGYETIAQYDRHIYGAYSFVLNGVNKQLIHAGAKLYEGKNVLYSNMAQNYSKAVQFGGKLWILDGKTYLYYNGTKVEPVEKIATVPLITIAKAPNGNLGATNYKPINLLTGKRTESYLGTENEKEYFLSFGQLSPLAVTAQVLHTSGQWIEKYETVNFTVDRAIGKIIFAVAPGKSPVTGEDNVRISYEVKKTESDKVNRCRFSVLYGVRGALDRIFVSGNPSAPNVDYWSEWKDPSYIGDTFYGLLGQEASPIMGYSIVDEMLVTHKKDEENGRNAFVRAGQLDDEGFALFPITGVLQGDGVISSRSFASINGEPVFLTKRGVQALTPNDITGKQGAQDRSFFVNGALLREKALNSACGVTFGRFYTLAINNRIYLLDSEQKSYEHKGPYSSHRYEAYYWTNIRAVCLWVNDGVLYFGTAEGKVCKFKSGDKITEYNDDGKAIACWWTTPLLNLGIWSNLKTVTGVWVVGQPYKRSSGEIYYASDKEYERFIRRYYIDILDFENINFNRWTFNTLDRPNIEAAGRKAKKVKLFQVKIKNEELNEPYGIYAVQIDYYISKKIKK